MTASKATTPMPADATPQSPEFSVVIVNYNSGDFLKGALKSLERQTDRRFEVIIWDNQSTDGSADDLPELDLPHVRLFRADANEGFARGNNLAAREARGAWLVLMNPDVCAEPDWISEISAGISRHPGANCFTCAQIVMDEPGLIDGAGDNYLVCGIPWRGGYRRSVEFMPGEGECFSPCGASTVIRTALFRQIGGFDERLFCYCEDVDLGFRLQLQGEMCVFLPGAVVHHSGGGSSNKISGFAVRNGTRNRLWVYVKNMPAAALLLTAPFHIAMTAAILMRGLFTNRFSDAWTGLVEGIRGIGPVLEDRRRLRSARSVPVMQLLGRMAWNPFRLLTRQTHVMPIRRLSAARDRQDERTDILARSGHD